MMDSRFGAIRWLLFLAMGAVIGGGTVQAEEAPSALPSPTSNATEAETWTSLLAEANLPSQPHFARRTALLQKIQALLTAEPADTEQALQEQRQLLLESVEALDQYLDTWSSGDGWRRYLRFEELRQLAESLPPERDAASLEKLKELLAKFDNPDLDAKYRVAFERPAFEEVASQLKQFVSLWEVRQAQRKEEVLARVRSLVTALEAHELQPTATSARTIREMIDTLDSSPFSIERDLADELRDQYLAPNLRLVVPQRLLGQFDTGPREMTGPVEDWLDGARIRGSRITHSTPAVELEPIAGSARLWVVLRGTVNSSTTAYKGPARIYSRSQIQFVGRKPIEMSVDGLQGGSPQVEILDVHNEITGADVDVPLFGGLARNTAISEARKRRHQAEALASRRVVEGVTDRLNREVGQSIKQLNEAYGQQIRQPLEQQGLFPASVAFRADSGQLWIGATVLSSGRLAADSPPLSAPTNSDAVIQVHQSVFNNAFDRWNLAGQTMSWTDIQSRIDKMVQPLLGTKLVLAETSEEMAPDGVVTFAQKDPLHVQFDEGQMTVVIHAEQLQQSELRVGPHVIRAQYVPVIEKEHLGFARREDVQMQPIAKGTPVVAASLHPVVAVPEAAGTSALKTTLETVFPTHIDLPRQVQVPNQIGSPISLETAVIEIRDGWLKIVGR